MKVYSAGGSGKGWAFFRGYRSFSESHKRQHVLGHVILVVSLMVFTAGGDYFGSRCLLAKVSAHKPSYPRKRVSSKINGFPLQDCGNDITGITAIKH